MAYDNKELSRLRELVILLIKRRGQAKKAITDIVQTCMNKYLNALPSRDEKYKMLETLREGSEGKMFLEREYS